VAALVNNAIGSSNIAIGYCEVQQQQRELAALKAQNVRLKAAVEQFEERDAALAARLDRLDAAA
jgi:cell division protein FtsB